MHGTKFKVQRKCENFEKKKRELLGLILISMWWFIS